MEPLAVNHAVLKFIGVCAVSQSTPKLINIRNQLFYTIMVVMHIINTILSGLYFTTYVREDYTGALYGFLSATVLLCNLHTLATLRYHSTKMRTIFATLEIIYKESKILKKIYLEKKIEFLSLFLKIHTQLPLERHHWHIVWVL